MTPAPFKLSHIADAAEEFIEYGRVELTPRLLAEALDPTLSSEARALKSRTREVRKQMADLRRKLADRGYRVVAVCQAYFDHPTKRPQTHSEARDCLALHGRPAAGIVVIEDGHENIMWAVYKETLGGEQYTSSTGHLADLRDAERAGEIPDQSTQQALTRAVTRAGRKHGWRPKDARKIEQKTALALGVGTGSPS
jgi:hypothetical protein